MPDSSFDQYAEQYDAWFLENRNVLESERRLIRHLMAEPGRALSVGCGSGLFEHLLRTEDGIDIDYGVEPTEGMAAIAEKRGMTVRIGQAESLDYDDASFDTVLFNGTPSYITDLDRAFREAWRVLRAGGRIVVADVPAESSYGLLYRLAARIGSWDDDLLQRVAPPHPYPIEFAAAANWRTTEEKANLLRRVGFDDLEFAQTLLTHPKHSDVAPQDPVEGFDRGDYVAIRANKPPA